MTWRKGERVLTRDGPGVVIRQGVCEYGPCKFGGACTEILVDRWKGAGSRFYRADTIELIEERGE